MSTFKTPTKKIDITANFTFNKTIEVPANWTGEQIDEWVWGIDLDPFYELPPDYIEMEWKMRSRC